MRCLRLLLYLVYSVLTAGCFLLSLGAVAELAARGLLPPGDLTGFRRVVLGVAGAATLMGLLHPLARRVFVVPEEGRLRPAGRWVARTFGIGEDELPKVTAFPWYIALLLGVVGFVMSLLTS